jgi:hypothetical protein
MVSASIIRESCHLVAVECTFYIRAKHITLLDKGVRIV